MRTKLTPKFFNEEESFFFEMQNYLSHQIEQHISFDRLRLSEDLPDALRTVGEWGGKYFNRIDEIFKNKTPIALRIRAFPDKNPERSLWVYVWPPILSVAKPTICTYGQSSSMLYVLAGNAQEEVYSFIRPRDGSSLPVLKTASFIAQGSIVTLESGYIHSMIAEERNKALITLHMNFPDIKKSQTFTEIRRNGNSFLVRNRMSKIKFIT
jgi:hypothetical protein